MCEEVSLTRRRGAKLTTAGRPVSVTDTAAAGFTWSLIGLSVTDGSWVVVDGARFSGIGCWVELEELGMTTDCGWGIFSRAVAVKDGRGTLEGISGADILSKMLVPKRSRSTRKMGYMT